jgi:hypothetical protein
MFLALVVVWFLKYMMMVPGLVAGCFYQVWLWAVAHVEMLTALGLMGLAGAIIYVIVYKWVK